MTKPPFVEIRSALRLAKAEAQGPEEYAETPVERAGKVEGAEFVSD